ncbi:MAG: isopentenyl-diphosphate Delta-isomerase [Pseudomonadaceae bacterium]|nr:isopentenyl-diphosphate Delta-isomerase [Pseudomonadaceae bacterium]
MSAISNRKAAASNAVVSDDAERLILVDERDEPVGYLSKAACHDGDGILHRAFSLFIFNSQGQLLIQKRASGKRLWPGFWSNSCCSHPREGESMEVAVVRRCEQELGFSTALTYLYKFSYQANYKDLGSEHELCSVYVGFFDGEPNPNNTEIDAWRWADPSELDGVLADPSEPFTPWFRLEWDRLNTEFADALPARS